MRFRIHITIHPLSRTAGEGVGGRGPCSGLALFSSRRRTRYMSNGG